jgi:beta-lactam-binding protein with PASTA domain
MFRYRLYSPQTFSQAMPSLSRSSPKRAIGAHGCRVGRVRHDFSKTVRKGRVISQAPKAQTRLTRGARVSLVVSSGKP